MSAGYVYLMRREDGLVKIGFSAEPHVRRYQVASDVRSRVTLVAIVRTDDAQGVEWAAHFQYADRRVEGEWFRFMEDEMEGVRLTIAKLRPIPAPFGRSNLTTIEVGKDLQREYKLAAVHLDATLRELIEEALRAYRPQIEKRIGKTA